MNIKKPITVSTEYSFLLDRKEIASITDTFRGPKDGHSDLLADMVGPLNTEEPSDRYYKMYRPTEAYVTATGYVFKFASEIFTTGDVGTAYHISLTINFKPE